MDDSAASADQSLNISDAFNDGEFCNGEKENIATCAVHLHQVRVCYRRSLSGSCTSGIKCRGHIISKCVCTCVQELRVMGLPSVLDRKSHQLDTPRLLNTIHRLMQLHRSNHLVQDDLRTR